MRCSYWRGRYVDICPGALIMTPAKESGSLPFGAVRGLAGWRGLCLATPCLFQEVLRPVWSAGACHVCRRQVHDARWNRHSQIQSHVIGAVDERGKDATKPCSSEARRRIRQVRSLPRGLGAPAREMLVGMEATGLLAAAVQLPAPQGYDVVVVNPCRTDAMRRFKGSSRVRTDLVDCILVADTLRLGEFRPSKLGDESMVHCQLAASPGPQGERRRPQAPGDSGAGPGIPRYDSIFFRHLRGGSSVPEEVPGPRVPRRRVDALGNTSSRARVAASSDGGEAEGDRGIAKESCGIDRGT